MGFRLRCQWNGIIVGIKSSLDLLPSRMSFSFVKNMLEH